MQHIQRYPLERVLQSEEMRRAIEEITAESYANPEVLLEQEYKKNNVAYLSTNSDGQVEAFFLVGWSSISIRNVERPNVFLGLSAVRAHLKGSMLAISLYRAFFREAEERAGSEQAITWWFHTASPIVAGVMWRIAPHIGPSPSGLLSERHRFLLDAVAEKYGFVGYQEEGRPFILRGLAKARYSSIESARLAARESRHSSILSEWNIQEASGDRLLFVGFSERNKKSMRVDSDVASTDDATSSLPVIVA